MLLDAGPAILILGPILSPIFVGQLGLDPLHFAIIMCINATVGLITPPMGLVLFVTSSVSGEPMGNILRSLVPFLLVEIAMILLITFVPSISAHPAKTTRFHVRSLAGTSIGLKTMRKL